MDERNTIAFGTALDTVTGVQKAYPFVYNLVPDFKKTSALPNGPIGQPIPIGISSFPIVLDPDYNFKLLWIKYTIMKVDRGVYVWYTPYPAWNYNFFNKDLLAGTPLTRLVQVSLSFECYNGTYLYGGQNTDPVNGRGSKLPITVSTIQGNESGCGQIRTPFWLPRYGALMFEVTNNIGIPAYINAAIYGLKVRV